MRRFLHKLKIYSIAVVSLVAVLAVVFVLNGLYHAGDTKVSLETPKKLEAPAVKPKTAPPEVADNRGTLTRFKDNLAGLVAGQCSVRGKTIPLTEVGITVNPRVSPTKPLCRIVGQPIKGKTDYVDEHKNAVPAEGWLDGDYVGLKARKGTGTAEFKYSLCPPTTSGPVDWECRPIKTARQ